MDRIESSQLSGASPPGSLKSHPNASGRQDCCRDKPLHLAIGMFDGVHIGHQAVIRQAIGMALAGNGHCSGVLTFDPHPSRVLYPDSATQLLMPLAGRIARIHSIGADVVFVQAFSREYAMQTAQAFVPSLQQVFPMLKSIHVGENFRFGSGRGGNVDTLRTACMKSGVELHALQRQVRDGVAISSSRIRALLMEGSIAEVNGMLGEPYSVTGRIIRGRGLGRTIDFPTVNIPWHAEVSPRYGVYQVTLRSTGHGGWIRGIANYGVRPTIGDLTDAVLEVHLLDSGAIPQTGDPVEVAFHRFIRPERAFDTVGALRLQIARDVALVRDSTEGGSIVR